jgi:hypothetical protein
MNSPAHEMQVHLDVAFELGYMAREEYEYHIAEYRIIARQPHCLIDYWLSMPAPVTSD